MRLLAVQPSILPGAGGRTPSSLPNRDHEPERTTEVRFDDADPLWRLCTRMVTPTEAARRAVVTGDGELAQRMLQIVSIIR